MNQTQNKININGNFPFYIYHEKGNDCVCYQGCGNASAEERGRKYSIENKSKKEIIKYKIDGGLITDDNDIKCDYGFYTEDDLLILVELKGGDYSHAIEQIINTIKLLITIPKIKISSVKARIVVSKIRQPELRSSDEQKLKRILDSFRKDNDNLKKQVAQMTEIL